MQFSGSLHTKLYQVVNDSYLKKLSVLLILQSNLSLIPLPMAGFSKWKSPVWMLSRAERRTSSFCHACEPTSTRELAS